MSIVHLPILMYHQIMPGSHPDFSKHIATTPERFKEQLQFLIDSGRKIMTAEEYFFTPIEKREKKAAIITFDDTCKNFIDYALPVLDELKVKSDIFVIQNMTFQKEFHNLKNQGIPGLSEKEIKQLDELGHRVGSHCQSHQNMHKMPFTEAKKEMSESKLWLEDVLGRQVDVICYPIGGIDSDILQTAKEIGYKIGFSTLKCSLQILDQDLLVLRRVDMKNHIIGDKLKFQYSKFYGLRRFLTRPFRAKYKVNYRHPDLLVS